ncbi:uncharacterized protein CDV56_102696 [Aspergillus thermomutatus]|uniref:Altered inheritance of mitochondria protein 9, mitochondrial n=1 Tax=Aspergillus thermomutatus TaxID=41047 RepID=A0A397G0G5_ASPTH|nr:uncharacterized protein CDV56_102696 [Aspergillus thermomutatus]RHZ44435.1 hypothetical protein CDV56_102696 [Aspergillus thermomutatus]
MNTISGLSKVSFLQQTPFIQVDSMGAIDPHAYTSGRWLRHDKVEHDSRYIKFNFEALCQRVIDLCPGADAIATCRKIEGGFNRVFIFMLNNAKQIVARLPFPLAGPAKLTTASEVATVCYLQARTSIPIPTILDWHNDAADADNLIGSEYIIMEHAAGVPLREKWQEMTGDQQVRCIDAIYRRTKEAVDLEFPAFGSIYFNKTLDSHCRKYLDKDFCIGPHCNTRYWDCNPGEHRYYDKAKSNHGPWTSIDEYCDGLIDTGILRVPPTNTEVEKKPLYHGSVQTHLRLLECARTVLRQIAADSRIQTAASPLLFHPDLHMRNIFVSEDDPSLISSIIDWQAASVEPAFWYSDEVPDFATGNDICAKTFELSSQFLTPKLSGPRLMNENLFRPFRYCYRTWKDGAVALRHEMIETSRHWRELGLEGQCPYPIPTSEELANHEMEYKLFEAAQNLRRDLSSLLNTASDGWVPLDNWEATEVAHKELFNGMLQAVATNADLGDDEPIKDENTLRSIWPFDVDG